MCRPHFPDLLGWHKKQISNVTILNKQYKSSSSQSSSVLEDIIHSAIAVSAVSLASLTVVTHAGLYYLNKWSEKDSKRIVDERDAQNHFQKILSHYGQDPAQYELRCTYQGLTYVQQVQDKYVVFLNMKMKPKKGALQHEVLHVLNGDMSYDPDNGNIFRRIKNWLRYFYYAEPRVCLRTKRELLG